MQETRCGSWLRDRLEQGVAKSSAICRRNPMTCRQSIWQDGPRLEYVRKAKMALFSAQIFRNNDCHSQPYGLGHDQCPSWIHVSYIGNGSVSFL